MVLQNVNVNEIVAQGAAVYKNKNIKKLINQNKKLSKVFYFIFLFFYIFYYKYKYNYSLILEFITHFGDCGLGPIPIPNLIFF